MSRQKTGASSLAVLAWMSAVGGASPRWSRMARPTARRASFSLLMSEGALALAELGYFFGQLGLDQLVDGGSVLAF